MGTKHEAPKGHLRDLRFLLLADAAKVVSVTPLTGREPECQALNDELAGSIPTRRSRYLASPDQPLNEYRAEMALHRRSSTASKRRRASTKRASPKPSAAPRKRSASSKAKTAAS